MKRFTIYIYPSRLHIETYRKMNSILVGVTEELHKKEEERDRFINNTSKYPDVKTIKKKYTNCIPLQNIPKRNFQ